MHVYTGQSKLSGTKSSGNQDFFLQSLWAILLGAMPSLAHQSVARRSSSWLWLFPGISGSVYQEHNQGEGIYNFSLRRAKYLSQEKLLWTMSCGFFGCDFARFAAQCSKKEYKVSEVVSRLVWARQAAANTRVLQDICLQLLHLLGVRWLVFMRLPFDPLQPS